MHLFTLAPTVVCFAADCKHNNRKNKCRFFGFRVIQRNTRSGKTLSNFNLTKIMETNAITNVNKKLVNRTVSFENELVPLNGRIHAYNRNY